VKNFTLTLWNVYSFFVTYANLDKWQPAPHAWVEGASGEVASDLDRWLLSELHALVRQVTNALEDYDVTGATRPIAAFVDSLSKWYLRRSRRRFWKGESDADKQSAYATLYEALVTLAKLLAPTMPFLAEEMYQNLVRSMDESAPDSIHLCDWPQVNPERIDENLNRDMELVIRLASLGHAARNAAAVKVRQPLSAVAFSMARAEESGALERFSDLLADELNVKQVRILGSAGEAVSYSLNPLPKQLGGKYKALFPRLRAAILALDANEAARTLLAGRPLQVSLDGQEYEIYPDEVEVRAEARAGLTVASEGAYLAALSTDLTPELVKEGLAREFVRRVQDLRKSADFDIADRIRLDVEASPGLLEAIQAHRDYIMSETLALELNLRPPTNGATTTAEFDGERMAVGIERAG
jgi:isoleucyl-tRNA synthetase